MKDKFYANLWLDPLGFLRMIWLGSIYTKRQHQHCDDTIGTALIENNEVTHE